MSSSPRRRRGRDSPREDRYRRRRDEYSRRNRDSPRRRRNDSPRSPSMEVRSPRPPRNRRSLSESPRRRRRPRSPERRDNRRRRSSSVSSDGIYADGDRRRGGGRRGREDRDGGRRGGRGGGGSYEDELRKKIKKLFKHYCDVYEMIKGESSQIRLHSIMRYAPKKDREQDEGDVKTIRSLKNSDSPLEMLKCFSEEAKTVRAKLNKNYRNYFFKESKKRAERHYGSVERYREDDRRDTRGIRSRHHRSRSSYDHEREPRSRRERQYSRDYDRNRSSRHRRRRDRD